LIFSNRDQSRPRIRAIASTGSQEVSVPVLLTLPVSCVSGRFWLARYVCVSAAGCSAAVLCVVCVRVCVCVCGVCVCVYGEVNYTHAIVWRIAAVAVR